MIEAVTMIAACLAPQTPPTVAVAHPPRFGKYTVALGDLVEPAAAAIDESGRIWIAEPLRAAIQVFEPNGKWFGSFDVLNVAGRTREPRGIAVSREGEVFVSDAFDDEVLVYRAKDGVLARQFGRRGVGPGELHEPAGLTWDARDGGRLYVADTLNHRVDVFEPGGKPIRSFGRRGAGAGELDHPVDVAVDSKGQCYVADLGNQRIAKFDAAGEFLISWGGFGPYAGLFMSPTGVEVFRDEVYVADRDNHRVQVFDQDGKQTHEWGEHALRPRESSGKLHYPNQVAVAPSGDFAAVVEGFEDRVQLFGPRDPNAEPPVPPEASTSAHYGGGCSLAGDLFAVLEPNGPTVALFDMRRDEPIEIGRFGREGSKQGQFLRPHSVQFDAMGKNLYVSDPMAARVSMFAIEFDKGEAPRFDPFRAKLVRSVDLGALAIEPKLAWTPEPAGLALGTNGELFVADLANARVLVLDARLNFVRALGSFGDGAGQLRYPTAVVVTRDPGRVFVVDARRACVQAFDAEGKAVSPSQSAGGSVAAKEFARLKGRPFGIAAGIDGSILVSNEIFHDVQKLSARDGTLLADLGARALALGTKPPLGRGEFFKPQGVAVDVAGRVFVVDHGNHRFQVLWGDGRYDTMWGARLFTEAAREKK